MAAGLASLVRALGPRFGVLAESSTSQLTVVARNGDVAIGDLFLLPCRRGPDRVYIFRATEYANILNRTIEMSDVARNKLTMPDSYFSEDLVEEQLVELRGMVLGYAEYLDDQRGWSFNRPRRLPQHLTDVFRVDPDRPETGQAVRELLRTQLGDAGLILGHAALGPTLPTKFEVIVDYKGMRRPPVSKGRSKASLWTQYEWQLQTYGELRRRQADALHVVAGVLLYVNELHPTRSDIERLKREIDNGTTDVLPAPGSVADTALKDWKTRDKQLPTLPFEYRLARALRVVPISPSSIQQALKSFDDVVKDIETCRGREVHGSPVLTAWTKNSSDEDTCVLCDSRTYCPDYQANYAKKHGEMEPRLPAVRP